MLDELLLQIMQLSKEDKMKILQTIEEDLNLMDEGNLMATLSISNEDRNEIANRLEDIIDERSCTIYFDDHIIHLQKGSND